MTSRLLTGLRKTARSLLTTVSPTFGACSQILTRLQLLDQKLSLHLQEREVLIRSLEETNAEKAAFSRPCWASGLTEQWKEYAFKHYAEVPGKMAKLKGGLDEVSCQTIDLIWNRHVHILPTLKYVDRFLLDCDRLYTFEERELLRNPMQEDEIRARYGIEEGRYLEMPVFRFHAGLTLLPNEVQQSIAGRDIIDGGALWGDSALVFATHYAPRRVFAFEPIEESFDDMQQTIRRNGLEETIIPQQTALGAETGEIELFTYEMLSGASSEDRRSLFWERPESRRRHVAPLTTVDEFVRQNDVDLTLLKLDVEGAELSVLRGALGSIKGLKPILLISIYHTPEDFFEIKPMIEELDLGYKFMVRKLVAHDFVTEVMLLAYP